VKGGGSKIPTQGKWKLKEARGNGKEARLLGAIFRLRTGGERVHLFLLAQGGGCQ